MTICRTQMPQTARAPRDDIVLHLPALRAFALGLCRSPDRADDLVQDTIVRAWSHFGSFTPGSNLRGWLFTILRNGYYSDLRKHRREVADPEGALVARLAVGQEHDVALAMGEFLVAFAALSVEHREVLTLVGALGFSYEEAAAATSLAVGTVKSRVSRARAILGACPLPGPDRSTIAVRRWASAPWNRADPARTRGGASRPAALVSGPSCCWRLCPPTCPRLCPHRRAWSVPDAAPPPPIRPSWSLLRRICLWRAAFCQSSAWLVPIRSE